MSRPRKYATTSEAEIRALCAEGLTFPQIAARLNVPLIPLRNAASLLGIASGRGHETNMPVNRWVAEFVANGVLIERMGEKPEGAPGSAPMEYGLSAVWGGHA